MFRNLVSPGTTWSARGISPNRRMAVHRFWGEHKGRFEREPQISDARPRIDLEMQRSRGALNQGQLEVFKDKSLRVERTRVRAAATAPESAR